RLFYVLKRFPENNKKIIGMCHNVVSFQKFFLKLPNTQLFLSLKKDKIPQNISENFGDIYINTGRYEGFCLSLVEAMSQGIVPITFSIGVVPEIIKNGKNGYIVKSLDEMVKKINYLQNKPKLRKKMALNAVKTSKQFNSNDLVKKLDKIYSSLVKN
ncbi:MAG TPA: glycosyltransferase, partial [archaeon]|nr:glycosyltransferase [archaeon]